MFILNIFQWNYINLGTAVNLIYNPISGYTGAFFVFNASTICEVTDQTVSVSDSYSVECLTP